jgi:hypothetical protein
MGMTSEMAKFAGTIHKMREHIDMLVETNTSPTIVNDMRDLVDEILDTLEEALFFNSDVQDDMGISAAVQERMDLACPHCSSLVYDNRIRKADAGQPSYTPKSPDFICSNDKDCSGMIQGRERKLRASWYLKDLDGKPKELPEEWFI